MAEDLAEILGKFALSSKELGGACLDREEVNLGVTECQSSLFGKFKGEKIVNYTGVKSFATAAWGYPKDLKVVELGPNFFQFLIHGEQERERILEGGPWMMDSQLLVLNRWYEGIEEDEKAFNEAPLWVQVWNLPAHWMSKEVGRKIGAVFNRVHEVIIPQTGSKEGRHIKLRVVADISQPLLRGTIVKMEGSTKWVSFKYERCPDFCYNYGIVGHSERNCKRLVLIDRGHLENQYGTWMRAGNGRSSPQKEPLAKRGTSDKHHWRLHNGNWVEVVKQRQQDPGLSSHVPSATQVDSPSQALEMQEQVNKQGKEDSYVTSQPVITPKVMGNRQDKEATIVASLYKLNMEAETTEARGQNMVSSKKKVTASAELKEPTQQEGRIDGKDNKMEEGKGVENQGSGGIMEENINEITLLDLMVEDKKKEAVIRQNRRLKKQLRSPLKRRTPLKEICINIKDSGGQGKRKFQLCDEEMEEVEGRETGGKRNKGCEEVCSMVQEKEEEGTSLIWAPKPQ